DYLRTPPAEREAHRVAAEARRGAGDGEAAEYHLNECARLQGKTPASSLEGVLLLAERGALGDKEPWIQSCLKNGDADRILLLEALAREYVITVRHEEAWDVITDLLKAQPDHHLA